MSYNTRDGRLIRVSTIGDLGIAEAAAVIRAASIRLTDHDIPGAISIIQQLPGSGLAFASNTCVFLDPEQCGVIDSNRWSG